MGQELEWNAVTFHLTTGPYSLSGCQPWQFFDNLLYGRLCNNTVSFPKNMQQPVNPTSSFPDEISGGHTVSIS